MGRFGFFDVGFPKRVKAIDAQLLQSTAQLTPEQLAARATGTNLFGISGNRFELAESGNDQLLVLGYKENNYVFTIADWKARRMAQARPIQYVVKDDKQLAKYKSIPAAFRNDAYSVREKALEEVEDPANALNKLLRNPNPLQTWAEFMYDLSVYWDFGNAIIHGNRLNAGLNAGRVQELYTVPPHVYTGRNPSFDGYQMYTRNDDPAVTLNGADVLHLRRFDPEKGTTKPTLWGMSKLRSARRLLAKSNGALEAEAELMMNRGGRTILFPKNQPWSDENDLREANKAVQDGRRKLMQAKTGGMIAMPFELGSIELSMSPVDLEIIASNKITKEDWCSLWHVETLSVFSGQDGATYANKEEANKASLRSGVLPDLELAADKLTAFLMPGYAGKNETRVIMFDTDCYPELHTDKTELANWIDKSGASLNQRLEMFGFGQYDNPMANIPLVPAGLVLATDLQTNVDTGGLNDNTY